MVFWHQAMAFHTSLCLLQSQSYVANQHCILIHHTCVRHMTVLYTIRASGHHTYPQCKVSSLYVSYINDTLTYTTRLHPGVHQTYRHNIKSLLNTHKRYNLRREEIYSNTISLKDIIASTNQILKCENNIVIYHLFVRFSYSYHLCIILRLYFF